MEDQGFQGRGGALVEEARRLMKQDEEEEAPAQNDGPKIKMNRIGKRGAKKPSAQETAAPGKKPQADVMKVTEKHSSGGGFSEKDIEFMKKAIQVLCQSTNPLGKSIDFVTDDIDSMSKEFDTWKKEASACQSQLAEQQKITEEVI